MFIFFCRLSPVLLKRKQNGFSTSLKVTNTIFVLMDNKSKIRKFLSCKIRFLFLFKTGKPLKSLPDLLKEYNLPPGLFPQNIICYEFDETKNKLTVFFSSPCEVTFKDGSAIRYATRVKGILLRGKLMGVEGMKTKVLVWVKVTTISVESSKSDKLWFTAGVKKSRSKNVYDTPHDAIKVVGEF